MGSWHREKINPLELIERYWPDASRDHITYDPDMRKGDYSIIRQSTHDGTLLFSLELLQNTLLPVVNMSSYIKGDDPVEWDRVVAIRYVVGPLRLVTATGLVTLPASKTHKFPGEKQRTRMPVRATIVTEPDQ